MRIEKSDLEELILDVAKQKFGRSEFTRRSLLEAVEDRLRSLGVWETIDDHLSGSSGLKSRGLASIDWRITDLKKSLRLLNIARDRWKLNP